MLHTSLGTLRYCVGPHGGVKLIVEADQDIVDDYYSMIPPYIDRMRQKYPAHISVVRKEVPKNLGKWGIHEGRAVSFLYDNELERSETYIWLNVLSKEMEGLREELGLDNHNHGHVPRDGFKHTFHMTVANTKC